MQTAPHTAHRLVAAGLSECTDFFAMSKISGEMIGSAMGFFFILVFTIKHIGCGTGQLTSETVARSTRVFPGNA